MAKDYYDTLGISKNASSEEIKKAFRKKAMKYHPDRNAGDKQAEQKFKEVSEAYEILSDPQKKQMYDQYGEAAFQQGGPGAGAGAGGFSGGFNFNDIDSIFDSFFGDSFGGGRRSSQARTSKGGNISANISLKIEDVLDDKIVVMKIKRRDKCSACDGTGSKSKSAPKTCTTCGGTGKVVMQQGFFSVSQTCPHCHGTGKQVSDPCNKCHGTGLENKVAQISVNIPAGVEDGMRLRVSQEGDMSLSGVRGDLFVNITVTNSTSFERKEADLYTHISISMITASLGGEVEVPLLNERVKIKVPAGCQPGEKLKLTGKGLPYLHHKSTRGNVYYIVDIKIPKKLSSKAKDLLLQLEKEL